MKTVLFTAAAAVILSGCGGGGGGLPSNLPDGYIETLKNVNAAEKAMFERANEYRVASGLVPFDWSDELHIAGKAHSKYCDANGIFEHEEDPDGKFFFGVDPSDRQYNAGYQYPAGEDLSFGGWDPNSSDSGHFMLESLMTAIYHRMPLLAQDVTEIGTGVNDDYGGWTGAVEFGAAPKKKMSDLDYVLFPAPGAMNIMGGFSGEIPNPLSDLGEASSGNPISVFFKPGCNVKMDDFTLRDLNESSNPEILKVMTSKNDPNDFFSSCDFALFPKEFMKIGHYYEAKFKYNGGKEIKWQFRIYVAPPPDIPEEEMNGIELVLTDDNKSFEIQNGVEYYLNVYPEKELDEPCSYGTIGDNVDIDINHLGDGSHYYTIVSNDSQVGATAEMSIGCIDDGNDVEFNLTIVE